MSDKRAAGDRDAAAPTNAWTRFWFEPTPTTGLTFLRVLVGVIFIAWILSFLGHEREFLTLNGWLDKQGFEDLQRLPNSVLPPIGWSILYLAGDNAGAFQTIYWLSIAMITCFTLGIATRLTGILTWVVVVSFLANSATSYEGDYLLAILAFYLAIAYLLAGQWNGELSMVERILGSRRDFVFAGWIWPSEERPSSVGANFAVRMLQIHVVIILLTSAFHRLQLAEWWSGVALWFPLHPPFQTTAESIQTERTRPQFTLFYLSLVQYLILAWHFGFPFFAWRTGRIARTLLLGGAIVYWLGSFFLFRHPLFGPFVFVGSLSYLRPEEWAWLKERARSVFGSAVREKTASEAKKVPV